MATTISNPEKKILLELFERTNPYNKITTTST